MSFIGTLPTDEAILSYYQPSQTLTSSDTATGSSSTLLALLASDLVQGSFSLSLSLPASDSSTPLESVLELLLPASDYATGSSTQLLSSEYFKYAEDQATIAGAVPYRELLIPETSTGLGKVLVLGKTSYDTAYPVEYAEKVMPSLVSSSDSSTLRDEVDVLLEGTLKYLLPGYRVESWWLNVIAFVPAVIVQTTYFYRFISEDEVASGLDLEWPPSDLIEKAGSEELYRLWMGEVQWGALIEQQQLTKL